MSVSSVALGMLAGLGLGLALPTLLRRRGPKRGSTQAVRGGGPSVRVPRDDLIQAVAACLTAAGAAAEHAALSARVLVFADCRGIPSHGVNRADFYASELEGGLIDGSATPVVVEDSGCCAVVDGRNGLGAVVSQCAVELAIRKAREHGVGWVVCKGSNHYGDAGYWANLALQQGLVGFSFTNTAPFMVPTGAACRAVGTNPICCFAPAAGGASFQLDMATTTVPIGKIEVMDRLGKRVPLGWGTDGRGQPCDCAEEVATRGGLTPLGGAEETAGYKGYGLGMLVEILASVLPGAAVGPDVLPWSTSREGRCDFGHCFVVLDPSRFGGGFEERLAAYIARMQGLPPAEPGGRVRVAGDPEKDFERDAAASGVELQHPVAIGLRAARRAPASRLQRPRHELPPGAHEELRMSTSANRRVVLSQARRYRARAAAHIPGFPTQQGPGRGSLETRIRTNPKSGISVATVSRGISAHEDRAPRPAPDSARARRRVGRAARARLSLPSMMVEAQPREPLAELRHRVDALFASASGRVAPTHAEMLLFVQRLNAVGAALLRERFPSEGGAAPAPVPKRQRLESVVCSGSWQRWRGSVDELEAERGASTYETVEVEVGGQTFEVRQFTENFWCSGCRLWDSSVALGRWLLSNDHVLRGRSVVELGCGVGLAGLCAARVARAVLLTDGEANLLPNVRHNVSLAAASPEARAPVGVACLNWGDDPSALSEAHGRFDVLLGADLIYSSGAPRPLAAAIGALVRPNGAALLAYPAGRHGAAELVSALAADGWDVRDAALDVAMLRGCSHQGTEEEAAANTIRLVHCVRGEGSRAPHGAAPSARPSAARPDEGDKIQYP